MKCKLFLFSAILVIVSCTNSEKEGSTSITYETTDRGLPYYYHEKSDTGQQAKRDDFLVLNLEYTLLRTDSLLFDSDEMPGTYRVKLTKPRVDNGNTIEDGLALMRVGDSMSFKVHARSFYNTTMNRRPPNFLISKDTLRFDVKLEAIQTKEEIEKEQKRILEKNKIKEKELLKDYVATNYPDAKPLPSGLYVIEIEKGTGKKVADGNYVSINYDATFINGEKFDSSIDREEVFSFDIGENKSSKDIHSQEIIEGLEEGVSLLQEGSKAVLIIPSDLAYGANGYGNLIQPYTTLVFTLEVLMVNKF